MDNIDIAIFILLSIFVGMIIAYMIPRKNIRGPNASIETKKKYYTSNDNTCFNYKVRKIKCPHNQKN